MYLLFLRNTSQVSPEHGDFRVSSFNSLWSESDHDPVCGLTNREVF